MKIKARRVTGLEKYIGLMFKSRERAEPLLFEFDEDVSVSIHSFFVRFPFIAAWLDENNEVLDMFLVTPGCIIRPHKPFRKILEIPVK